MKRRTWFGVLPYEQMFEYESSAETYKERQEIHGGKNIEIVHVTELRPDECVVKRGLLQLIVDSISEDYGIINETDITTEQIRKLKEALGDAG